MERRMDVQQLAACDFEGLFQSLDFEEMHNHNSMAVCGDCLNILEQM